MYGLTYSAEADGTVYWASCDLGGAACLFVFVSAAVILAVAGDMAEVGVLAAASELTKTEMATVVFPVVCAKESYATIGS